MESRPVESAANHPIIDALYARDAEPKDMEWVRVAIFEIPDSFEVRASLFHVLHTTADALLSPADAKYFHDSTPPSDALAFQFIPARVALPPIYLLAALFRPDLRLRDSIRALLVTSFDILVEKTVFSSIMVAAQGRPIDFLASVRQQGSGLLFNNVDTDVFVEGPRRITIVSEPFPAKFMEPLIVSFVSAVIEKLTGAQPSVTHVSYRRHHSELTAQW